MPLSLVYEKSQSLFASPPLKQTSAREPVSFGFLPSEQLLEAKLAFVRFCEVGMWFSFKLCSFWITESLPALLLSSAWLFCESVPYCSLSVGPIWRINTDPVLRLRLALSRMPSSMPTLSKFTLHWSSHSRSSQRSYKLGIVFVFFISHSLYSIFWSMLSFEF